MGPAVVVGVAGLVAAAHVSFRFHNAPGKKFVPQAADQDLAQEPPGGFQGILGIEFTGKPCHFLTSVLEYWLVRP